MEKELQQYADIIEQLKSSIGAPEFNQILMQLTQNLPSEKRFLIKMELKRLAKPCVRSIDLRGQVDGECKLFEYRGRKHYLDDVAIDVFNRQVNIFGNYTFGVYETVMATENNFRVMRERAEQQALQGTVKSDAETKQENLHQYSIPVVNLLNYAHRNQERMNFAVAVEIQDESGSQYKASSVDISTEGLRLKLPKEYRFRPEQKLHIFFRGLEDEFAMDKRSGIVYEVITTKFEKSNYYLILKRNRQFPSPSFDKFLDNFIHGNKRRYKVNLTNTIDAIINKTAEQYISPCSPSLPVFIDSINDALLPRYAMLNTINKDILDYWKDETGEIKLGYLLKPLRLAKLQADADKHNELYVYCFTHIQNGAVYFYSASTRELEQKESLKSVFIGFGSRKVSWRVFKLTMSTMSPDEAHCPLSIPDDVGSVAKKQNTPPSARLMAKLKRLQYLVHVTDVTSESGQRQYAALKFDRSNLAHLRIFAHPRNKQPAPIRPYRYRFQEQRMETRYILRSPVVLSGLDETMQCKGISEDISISGLRLEIPGEFDGEKGSLVKISLPELQALTTKHDVTGLIYEVVYYNTDRNIVHLRAAEGESGAAARKFFDNLIKQNKQALKTYPEEEEIPGIGHALRCINARHTPNFAFLLAKNGIRYEADMAVMNGVNSVSARMLTHFTGSRKTNVEFLYRDKNLEAPLMLHGIKTMRLENQPLRQELFVAYDPARKNSKLAILPKLDKDFANDDTRKSFITEALARGHFIAMQVILTTTGKPDLDMLQAELSYVSMYALHRAKELEEKIWGMGASVHLVDMTSEVMMRFGYDKATISRNSQLRAVSESTAQIEKILNN